MDPACKIILTLFRTNPGTPAGISNLPHELRNPLAAPSASAPVPAIVIEKTRTAISPGASAMSAGDRRLPPSSSRACRRCLSRTVRRRTTSHPPRVCGRGRPRAPCLRRHRRRLPQGPPVLPDCPSPGAACAQSRSRAGLPGRLSLDSGDSLSERAPMMLLKTRYCGSRRRRMCRRQKRPESAHAVQAGNSEPAQPQRQDRRQTVRHGRITAEPEAVTTLDGVLPHETPYLPDDI